MAMYPLRFQPTFREYLWGGRRLESVLGKRLGDGPTYAESWEVVDHGADQSVVIAGAFAGRSLNDLVSEQPLELVGRRVPSFPLLFKFLDAQKDLSVQVHPTDAQAALLDPPDLGKTEAWVVLAADPGSVLYAGLREGVDRSMFERHIESGTTAECLHVVQPQVGDCVFVPAGAVHAIGAGLLVAEIQQASDTTYRVFDWNRVDAHGNGRQLHVQQALEVIDFELGPIDPAVAQGTHLVSCDKFTIHRHDIHGEHQLGGTGQFQIVAVLDGSLDIAGDAVGVPLRKGQTCLLPASLGPTPVTGESATVLLMSEP